MRVEPKVTCRYATRASNIVLADVATLVEAVPAGETLRVVTELPEVVEAVRAWCAETGTAIVHEDETRILTMGGCITEYALDLQRRPPLGPATT